MWALYVDTGVIFIHFVCIVHYNTRFDIDILNGGTPYEHFSPPLLPPHIHTHLLSWIYAIVVLTLSSPSFFDVAQSKGGHILPPPPSSIIFLVLIRT